MTPLENKIKEAKAGFRCKRCNRIIGSEKAWLKHTKTPTHNRSWKATRRLLGSWITKRIFDDDYSREFVLWNEEEKKWV